MLQQRAGRVLHRPERRANHVIAVDDDLRAALVQLRAGNVVVGRGDQHERLVDTEPLPQRHEAFHEGEDLLAGLVLRMDHDAIRSASQVDFRARQRILQACSGDEALDAGEDQEIAGEHRPPGYGNLVREGPGVFELMLYVVRETRALRARFILHDDSGDSKPFEAAAQLHECEIITACVGIRDDRKCADCCDITYGVDASLEQMRARRPASP